MGVRGLCARGSDNTQSYTQNHLSPRTCAAHRQAERTRQTPGQSLGPLPSLWSHNCLTKQQTLQEWRRRTVTGTPSAHKPTTEPSGPFRGRPERHSDNSSRSRWRGVARQGRGPQRETQKTQTNCPWSEAWSPQQGWKPGSRAEGAPVPEQCASTPCSRVPVPASLLSPGQPTPCGEHGHSHTLVPGWTLGLLPKGRAAQHLPFCVRAQTPSPWELKKGASLQGRPHWAREELLDSGSTGFLSSALGQAGLKPGSQFGLTCSGLPLPPRLSVTSREGLRAPQSWGGRHAVGTRSQTQVVAPVGLPRTPRRGCRAGPDGTHGRMHVSPPAGLRVVP